MDETTRTTAFVALGHAGSEHYADRNEGVFCEALAVKIRDDVAEALELPPDKVRVALTQKARGGITITATA